MPLDTAAPVARPEQLSASPMRRLLGDVLAEPHFEPQRGGSTYAEKITPADRQLDLGDPLDSWRRIRALSPHIGARAELQGRDVTIWRARLDDGVLVPEIVQPSGRSRMSYDEFLRGLR
jgi:methionyl-tRNA formyltransferase